MANGTEEVEKRNSEAIEMAMKDGPDATCPGCGLSRATNGWIGDICPFCRVCRYCGFENGDVKLPFGVDGKHTNRGHHIFK